MSFLNQKVEFKTLLIGMVLWGAILWLLESGLEPWLITLASVVSVFSVLAFFIALAIGIVIAALEK